MSKIHEKFAATAFKSETSMTFEQALAAADNAATRSAGMVTKLVRADTDAQRGRITYRVKRGGVLEVGVFEVTYTANEGGPATIAFVPGEYITTQASVLFISFGPKDSAALKPFQTFSKLLKQSVASSPAV